MWAPERHTRTRSLSLGSSAPPACTTVQFNPWFGGVTVRFDDHSGYDANCTYNADWYHSLPFNLKAYKSYDMVIWPSSPEHRNWFVSVNCVDTFGSVPINTTGTVYY